MPRPKPELGSDRLPALSPDKYTNPQREAAARLIATPRGEVRGPFIALLRSPELLDRAQNLGEYLRYRCSVPKELREVAILATAVHWRQPYEWQAHVRSALEAGVNRQTLEDIAENRELTEASQRIIDVYEFVRELHQAGAVGDPNYSAVVASLGEQGLVDLVGICGYYAMLGMMLNVARTPSPDMEFSIPA
jgi:4-carboxymuconolactone decarboxylase